VRWSGAVRSVKKRPETRVGGYEAEIQSGEIQEDPRAGPDGAILGLVIFMGAMPKKLEQISEVTLPDQGELEFEHGVLPGVDVDGVDFRRAIEQVVEGVAPSDGIMITRLSALSLSKWRSMRGSSQHAL
jgi:hypothetical protein